MTTDCHSSLQLEILLIRHGETDANRALRFQGHADVPLNVNGKEQARLLGRALDAQGAWARTIAVYSSDLQRARETARLAVQGHGSWRVQPCAELREQCFGVFEGLTFAEAVEQHAAEARQWRKFDPDYVPPGGESTRQFHGRIMQELMRIVRLHAGMRPQSLSSGNDIPIQVPAIMLIVHGGVVDIVWRELQGLALSGPRVSLIPNVGINHVGWDGRKLCAGEWADARHVETLATQALYDPQKWALNE